MLKDGYPLDLNFYPQLKKLIMISKTIPVSTATVERSFSAMNRILSWARSSLDSTAQGWENHGPRAKCGPWPDILWPARLFYCGGKYFEEINLVTFSIIIVVN